MYSKSFLVALAIIFQCVAPVFASEVPTGCTEVPDSFAEWRLLDIQDDEVKVIRWFQHPTNIGCRGVSIALLLDCKEYQVARSVFTLGENDVAVKPWTLLRTEDDQWKTGSGVNMIFRRDVASGTRLAIFKLNSPEQFTREVMLTEPCERRW